MTHHYVAIAFAVYMGVAGTSYAALLWLSFRADREYRAGVSRRELQSRMLGADAPAITLLAGAKNEQLIIAASVRAFLGLPYPNLSLVIVDDGSTDKTFDILRQEFKLEKSDETIPESTLRHQPILSIWQSRVQPRLRVVQKVASRGSKGDACNAGLEIVNTPLVFTTDIDSVLEPDAISRMLVYMQETGAVGVGCPLCPLNGVTVEDGMVKQIAMPGGFWERAQVVEYQRAFQLRQGWAYLGMLSNISGAAGLFQARALREIGGYRPDTTAEDVAATFHFHLRKMKLAMEPSVNVYTQVPERRITLRSQRKRWARGLLDTLWFSRALLNPWKHGRLSLLAAWLWTFEVAEPFVQTAGLAIVTADAFTGYVHWRGWLVMVAGMMAIISLSMLSVALRQRSYPRWAERDRTKLMALSLVEILPFKVLLSLWWRMVGALEYLTGDTSWELLPRQTFGNDTKEEKA
jgi:cellulose synthase/poly-beta-1,6-N-acetylglucosamine synthase-like glycosyltransferase